MAKNVKAAQSIVLVNTEDLKPYEKNARTHPEEQIRKLVDSIRDFGFNVPILIGEDEKIIAGHGRLIAAKRLNMKKVPCIRLGHLSEEDRRRFIAVDNLTHGMGGYDIDILKLEASEVSLDLAAYGIILPEVSGGVSDSRKETEIDFSEQKFAHTCPKCKFEFDE
jgi:ParB-like chromosome segregation protein Spo0J